MKNPSPDSVAVERGAISPHRCGARYKEEDLPRRSLGGRGIV
jgi:hypothetical protein